MKYCLFALVISLLMVYTTAQFGKPFGGVSGSGYYNNKNDYGGRISAGKRKLIL